MVLQGKKGKIVCPCISQTKIDKFYSQRLKGFSMLVHKVSIIAAYFVMQHPKMCANSIFVGVTLHSKGEEALTMSMDNFVCT